MCGIAGFIATGGGRPGRELLERMASVMVPRGPDASGAGLYGDGRIGFAHRRLSIIELSEAGAQPMTATDGECSLSFNGEVYNFRELRGELEGRGCRFRGDSDTEVVLLACREWGVAEAVSRFIGMFAFAYWDGGREKLYLVRDRLGIKPLYVARAPGLVLFASQLKPFLQCPSFSREVDRRALQYFLQFQYVPIPHCIYRDAAKVRPGTIVEYDLHGGEERRAYWQIADHWGGRDGQSVPREEEAAEELQSLLVSSVRYRMVSDVPLGAFLSGGIDSSLTAALMQGLSERPVNTFAIGFAERSYDESPFAAAVAKHLGTEHRDRICSAAEALALVRQLPDAYDEPFADSSAIPTLLLSAFTRQHVTVSLSGDGGDELFCGYPRYSWIRQAGRLLAIPAFLRKPAFRLLGLVPIHRVQKGAQSLLENDAAEFYLRTVGIFDRPSLARLLPAVEDDSALTWFRSFRDTSWGSLEERAMATDIQTYLVDDILTKVDRASMASSLEARVPLLDHRVVEFASRLPLDYKFRRGVKKYLLRGVLHGLVPPRLVERPKMGFGIPLNRWLRRELRPLVDEYLDPGRVKREGFFKPEGVSQVVKEHMAGTRDHQHRLWALLMFGLWKEKYKPT